MYPFTQVQFKSSAEVRKEPSFQLFVQHYECLPGETVRKCAPLFPCCKDSDKLNWHDRSEFYIAKVVQRIIIINALSSCVHFQQQAFNAASAINHMKKLQLSHSEPPPSPLALPDIMVQAPSHSNLELLGGCHDEAHALDPNGNLVHVVSHHSCSLSEPSRSLCPPLRESHSEAAPSLTIKEPVQSFHSESDAHLRPSKR